MGFRIIKMPPIIWIFYFKVHIHDKWYTWCFNRCCCSTSIIRNWWLWTSEAAGKRCRPNLRRERCINMYVRKAEGDEKFREKLVVGYYNWSASSLLYNDPRGRTCTYLHGIKAYAKEANIITVKHCKQIDSLATSGWSLTWAKPGIPPPLIRIISPHRTNTPV